MRKILFIIVPVVLITGAGLGWWFIYRPAHQPPAAEEYHVHAVFQVFNNDQLVNFSDLKYQKIAPCTAEKPKTLTAAEEQLEKAHLHDGVSDVVHVHRPTATWRDLFTNMGYPIASSVRGIVNGEEIPNILDQRIKADSRTLFIEGAMTSVDQKIQAVPDIEYLRRIEQSGESC